MATFWAQMVAKCPSDLICFCVQASRLCACDFAAYCASVAGHVWQAAIVQLFSSALGTRAVALDNVCSRHLPNFRSDHTDSSEYRYTPSAPVVHSRAYCPAACRAPNHPPDQSTCIAAIAAQAATAPLRLAPHRGRQRLSQLWRLLVWCAEAQTGGAAASGCAAGLCRSPSSPAHALPSPGLNIRDDQSSRSANTACKRAESASLCVPVSSRHSQR